MTNSLLMFLGFGAAAAFGLQALLYAITAAKGPYPRTIDSPRADILTAISLFVAANAFVTIALTAMARG